MISRFGSSPISIPFPSAHALWSVLAAPKDATQAPYQAEILYAQLPAYPNSEVPWPYTALTRDDRPGEEPIEP
jgi:hypothetical protein